MGIKTKVKRIIHEILVFVRNPSIYVAAVIGTLIGVLIGSAVGLASGGFIGYAYNIGAECTSPPQFIDPSIGLGAFIGLFIGGLFGGIFSGAVTMFRIHKKTHHLQILSNENITGVLLTAFYLSIEIAIGMGLGAIIGSLKLPGIGSILGALAGIVLMLFTSTLEKNKKID